MHDTRNDPLSPADRRSAQLHRLLSGENRLILLRGLPGSGRSSLISTWLMTQPSESWARLDTETDLPGAVPASVHTVVVTGLTAEQEPAWREVLRGYLDQGTRVIVIPKGIVTLDRLSVHRTVIDQHALAWDAAAVRRVVKARELEVTDEVVDELVAKTAGWAALVVAATESWPIGSVVTETTSGLTVAMETLRRQLYPEIRNSFDPALLLALSLESGPAVDMLEAVLGRNVSEEIGQLAVLGLVRRIDERGLARVALVPLMRDLIREDDGDVLRTQQNQAADWAIAAAQPGSALEHALGVDDERRVEEVLDRWGVDLLVDERRGLVPSAVRAVLNNARSQPLPGVGHLAEYFGLLPLGTTPVPRAVEGIGRRDSPELERLLSHGLIAVLSRRRQFRAHEAAALSRSLFGVLKEIVPSRGGRDLGIVPLWLVQHGISLAMDLDFVAAQESMARGWDLRSYDRFGFAGRAGASFAAAIQAIFGEPADARRWFERADTESPVDLDRAGWVNGPIAIARQVLAQDQMNFTESATFLGEGFGRDDEFWPFRFWVYFRHHVQVQDLASATALVEFVENRYPMGEMDGLYLAATSGVSALTMLMSGHATRARRFAEMSPSFILNSTALARIQLSAGDPERCHQTASKGLADMDWSPRGVLTMQTTLSAAALMLGRQDEAWTRLKTVIELAQRRDMVGLLNDVPRNLLDTFAGEPAVAAILKTLDTTGLRESFPTDVDVIKLTDREQLVLAEIATGRSFDLIARGLVVSVNTVKTQTRSLYRKLEVANREEAVAKAYSLGLLRS